MSGLSGDTMPGHEVVSERVQSGSQFLSHIKGFQLRVVALWSFTPLITHLASEAGEGELDSSRGSSPEGVRINLVWLILMPQRRIKRVTPCERESASCWAQGPWPVSLSAGVPCRLIVLPPRPAVSVLGMAG